MQADPVRAPDAPSEPLAIHTEVSLAPRQGELLSLPFDQYGRMRVVQNLLLALYTELSAAAGGPQDVAFSMSILDVGGFPGILRHFAEGPAYQVSVLDVVPDDGEIPGYTQGSGLDLPFADSSFDVVTSLDTLEHIPNDNRSRFLEELMRVARHGILIVNPVQTLENDLSEELLDEYVRWILDAQQEQLAEHRAYGLPDFDLTRNAFENSGWKTTAFSVANVYNWLFMMVAKHYLISLRTDQAASFERALDRFYNLSFSENDRTAPAYRGVIVAVKPCLEPVLRRAEALYPPVEPGPSDRTERLELAQLLMTLVDLKVANHEDHLLREQMERRDQHIQAMEGKIALLEGNATHLEARLADTQAALDTSHAAAEAARTAAEAARTAAEVTRTTADTEFQKHEAYIRLLEGEVKSKDEHIIYLEKLLQGIESGRVMRITRSLARFLGRK